MKWFATRMLICFKDVASFKSSNRGILSGTVPIFKMCSELMIDDFDYKKNVTYAFLDNSCWSMTDNDGDRLIIAKWFFKFFKGRFENIFRCLSLNFWLESFKLRNDRQTISNILKCLVLKWLVFYKNGLERKMKKIPYLKVAIGGWILKNCL